MTSTVASRDRTPGANADDPTASSRATDSHGGTGRDDRARPSLSLLQAVVREWPVFLAPVVLLTVAAIVAGLVRSPQYTASTQVAVGRIDVSAPGALAGFTEATEALASSYSRAVNASAVVTPVAGRLNMDPGEVVARLTATPVPQSPVFTVYAIGDSAEQAVTLANSATDSLVRYIDATNSREDQARQVYAEYKRASRTFALRRAAADSLEIGPRDNPTPRETAVLADAQADAQGAKLRVNALEARYRATQQAAPSASLVQVLQRAESPLSDRLPRLQLFVFIALVTGVAAGLGLALLRANRRARTQLL